MSGSVAVIGIAMWVVPAGASVASAGNGEATKDPATILADAKAATGASTTVRISGSVVSAGKRTSLNLVSSRGTGGGTVSVRGATIHIVVVPPNVYLKADKASWTKLTGTAAAGALLAGKWLQTTTADPNFASFASLLDAPTLTQSLTATDAVTKGAVTTFHGKKAVTLEDGIKNGKLYVAATGAPYILGIVGTGAKKDNEILFTEYGSAKVPSAPADAINLSQLEQTSGSSQ